MSDHLRSTQDYLASPMFMEHGARIFRTPRGGHRGFIRDTQGKNNDYRSQGMRIPTHQLEFAELTPDQVRDTYDKDTPIFNARLKWQPLQQRKAKAVYFQWGSGACSTQARMKNGFGGSPFDRGPQGGGNDGGGLVS